MQRVARLIARAELDRSILLYDINVVIFTFDNSAFIIRWKIIMKIAVCLIIMKIIIILYENTLITK